MSPYIYNNLINLLIFSRFKHTVVLVILFLSKYLTSFKFIKHMFSNIMSFFTEPIKRISRIWS